MCACMTDIVDAPKSGTRKGGRPPYVPTDENRRSVVAYKAVGTTHEVIAKLLQISIDTLERHYRTELDHGAAIADAQVGETLWKKAMSGDTGAMIWWSKARMRWAEKPAVGDKDNPLIVQQENVNVDAVKLADMLRSARRAGAEIAPADDGSDLV